MRPTITLSLDLGWGGREIRVTREISETIIQRAYAPIDHPSPDADPFIRTFICTDPGTLKTVVKFRKDAAKMIADAVSAALIEMMQRGDTLMGYPIERTPHEEF